MAKSMKVNCCPVCDSHDLQLRQVPTRALGGFYAGAYLGSVVPGVGTLVGAVIGAALGGASDYDKSRYKCTDCGCTFDSPRTKTLEEVTVS